MDEKIGGDKVLSMDDFAGVYVGCALDKLRESPATGVFDNYMRKEVSKILKIDRGLVKRLSNPFHWELFCNGGDLAEYIQPTYNGEESVVRLKRDYDEKDVVNLKENIMDKHGGLLSAVHDSYLTGLKNC